MSPSLEKPETVSAEVNGDRKGAPAIWRDSHTPGPWWVSPAPYPEKLHVRRNSDRHPTLVCSVNRTADDEDIANARLIAAAPDLKAFAESFLIYQVEGDEEFIWFRVGGEDIACIRAESTQGNALLKVEAARRAAIAKATGGA